MKTSVILSSLLITLVAGAPAPLDSVLSNAPALSKETLPKAPGVSSFTSSEEFNKKQSTEQSKNLEVTNDRTGSSLKMSEHSATQSEVNYKKNVQILNGMGITPLGGPIGGDSFSSGSFASDSRSSFSESTIRQSFQRESNTYVSQYWNQYKFNKGRVSYSGGSGRFGWLWGGHGHGQCGKFNIDNYGSFPVYAMTQGADKASVFSLGSNGMVGPYQSSGFSSFSQKKESRTQEIGATYFSSKNGAYGMSFRKDSEFRQSTKIVQGGFSGVYTSSPSSSDGNFLSFTPRRVCVDKKWLIIFEHPEYTPMLCVYNNVQKLFWFKDCSRPIKYCVPARLVIFGY